MRKWELAGSHLPVFSLYGKPGPVTGADQAEIVLIFGSMMFGSVLFHRHNILNDNELQK